MADLHSPPHITQADHLYRENCELRRLLADVTAHHARLIGAVGTMQLRAGYILGTCRGEMEMKAEARAMLDAARDALGGQS